MSEKSLRKLYGFCICVFAVLGPSPLRADELRGMWVNGWDNGFHTQAQVDQLLGIPGDANSKGDIRNGNCNAVFVQVRRRADVAYPSGMSEPYMSGLTPANFNALQAIINAAHDTTGGKQRIEVHCWSVVFKTAKGEVYDEHSDTGNPDNYWPTRLNSVTGAENGDGAFDPGHPKCLEYLVDVHMDLVNNFDIDGIHYDYIRFEAATEGFNPTSVARYKARYGLSTDPLSSDPQFAQWRRDQVSTFVRQVYARIQASKPNVKQSVAGVTWDPAPASSTRTSFQGTRPYYQVYSDWDSWMQEGILDMAVPMAYFDWAGSYSADYTKWMNFTKDRKANRHAIIGPGLYLNSLSNAIYELQMTRNASPAGNYAQGYNGYEYILPYKSGSWAGFQPSLVAQVNPTTASIPVMPWKTAPTKAHIMGRVTYADSGAWADHALVTLSGPDSRSMYVDGTGFYAFIDLSPGSYTVTAQRAGYTDGTASADVAIGQVTGNMYERNLLVGGNVPPIISDVQATGVTDSVATITWTTHDNASSQVEHGLTTAYGSMTPLDETAVTAHVVPLSGLAANTLYHFRVISTNSYGTTTSGDFTFTTNGPPTVGNVQASPTSDGATITWTTNAPATSQLRYGLTAAYGSETTLDPANVTSHSVVLSGLSPTTLYHYQVVSGNAYGSAESDDFTVTTAGAPGISGVNANGITASGATIVWTTDVPADSQVEYGTTTGYGSSSALYPAMVTAHSVSLGGLTASTLYHYRVRSANAGGTTHSGDHTFTTSTFSGDVIVDNTDSGFAYLLGDAWSTGTASIKYGTNYFYCNEAAGTSEDAATHKACWTPTLPVSGTWDVYIWYARGTNRTTNSYWKIINAGATQNLRVNQELNGNGWTLLSSDVPFAGGIAGNVQMWNNTGVTGSSQVVQGDAVRFVFKAGDTQPPTVPGDLNAAALSASAVQLNWDAATDTYGVSGYRVYRDGVLIGQPATTSYLDAAAPAANTTYSYQVSACDTSSNESAQCAAVIATTLSVPPGPGSVTPGVAGACVDVPVLWTPAGGFGADTVQYYGYAWNQSGSYTFAGSEPTWASGTLSTTATATGIWYLHVRGYNLDGVPNGEFTYGISAASATVFTQHPQSQPICSGRSVSLLVVAAGGGTLSYQWQKNGGDIFGATGPTLIIDPVLPGDAGEYRCMVTSDCGTVASGVAVLTVNVPLPSDLDEDCDVDGQDLLMFGACGLGPDVPYDPDDLPEECSLMADGEGKIAADFDRDGDVDQEDFGVLQRCFAGADVQPEASCGP